jgi:hypothetical protein
MLVDEKENEISSFIILFKKKFSNFCSKSPCILSFTNDNTKVIIKEMTTEIVKDFNFDFNKNVKQNIKIIKDWLIENVYPTMIQEQKIAISLTNEEIEKKIDEGISPEEAVLLIKEKLIKTTWRIEKILVKKDELFCRNLDTGKQYRFKILMPSTIFLRDLRSKWTKEYAYKVFEKKSKMLNEIMDIDDNGVE